MFFLWLRHPYHHGWLGRRTRGRVPGRATFCTVFFLFWTVLWIAIVFGWGRLVTETAGFDGRASYQYLKWRYHYAYLVYLDVPAFGRFNFQPADYATMPRTARLEMSVRRSWFGEKLTGYYAGGYHRPISFSYPRMDDPPAGTLGVVEGPVERH